MTCPIHQQKSQLSGAMLVMFVTCWEDVNQSSKIKWYGEF